MNSLAPSLPHKARSRPVKQVRNTILPGLAPYSTVTPSPSFQMSSPSPFSSTPNLSQQPGAHLQRLLAQRQAILQQLGQLERGQAEAASEAPPPPRLPPRRPVNARHDSDEEELYVNLRGKIGFIKKFDRFIQRVSSGFRSVSLCQSCHLVQRLEVIMSGTRLDWRSVFHFSKPCISRFKYQVGKKG